jgi:hypothetical protein
MMSFMAALELAPKDKNTIKAGMPHVRSAQQWWPS